MIVYYIYAACVAGASSSSFDPDFDDPDSDPSMSIADNFELMTEDVNNAELEGNTEGKLSSKF